MKSKTNKGIKIIISIIIIGVLILPMFNYAMSNLGFLNQDEDVENKDSKIDEDPNKIEESNEIEEEIETESAIDKVEEAFVIAEMAEDSIVYNNYSKNREYVGDLQKGQLVEVIRDRCYQWYLVKSKDGQEGWVSSTSLLIPDDPETNHEQMTDQEIEEFINYKNFKSDTDYLIWVDIDRQMTHILLKRGDKWQLHRSMLSATGKNTSPTIKGLYKIEDRGKSFYNTKLENGAKNWVRFEGLYLFHSLVTDQQGKVIDHTLGKRASDGCIRLSLEDSKWFYENIEENSTVFVN